MTTQTGPWFAGQSLYRGPLIGWLWFKHVFDDRNVSRPAACQCAQQLHDIQIKVSLMSTLEGRGSLNPTPGGTGIAGR